MSVGDDGWVKHAPHLAMKGVIQTGPLNAVHAVNQVALDDEILLLGIRYSLPGILENISQGVLDVSFASVPIYLSNHSWIPQIRYRLIDYELPRATPPELLPHSGVHAAVVVGLSSNVNGDGLFQVCFAITSSDKEILGAIPSVFSHDHRLLLIPLPILWVWDIDGVVMATFRVVDNEADRCVVSIIGFVSDPVEVNGAEGNAEHIFLWEWLGSDGELGEHGWFGGSVFWG